MTPTAPPLPAREARRVAWETYRDHVLACPIAERGRWCRTCLELDDAARVASYADRPLAAPLPPATVAGRLVGI